MDNRRLALLAGLGIVELWVVGLMIRSVGGGREADIPLLAGPRAFAARTLQTGPAPHVVIAAGEGTALAVGVRPGTAVEVAQERQPRGWTQAGDRRLTFERTGDGVRIAREPGGPGGFGAIRGRLDVIVPPAARLEVENAGSMTVSGLRAAATLRSGDGSIFVRDQRGAVNANTANGRIDLRDVEAPSVEVASRSGRVRFDRVRADRIAIVTADGRIEVTRSLVHGGTIQTGSGRIRLALDPLSDVTVNARATAGRVVAEAPLSVAGDADDDESASSVRVGDGSGRLEVASAGGSITVLAQKGYRL
jgi:hypothetical protein